MSSSSNHDRRPDQPRYRAARNALLWLGLLALALFPFPWWW